MRLIDADELTEHIKILGIISEDKNVFTDDIRNAILRRIDAMPTAYDPERVVEQLKNEQKFWEHAYDRDIGKEKVRSYAHAIEIVKGGGVDGN